MSENTLIVEPIKRHAPDGLILCIACIAQFMVVLDVSIVNVALPRMGHDLHFSYSSAQWVVNAYVLTFAGFLLLGGRAADYFGRRHVYLTGIALFTLASIGAGFAQTGTQMVTDPRHSGHRRRDPLSRDAHDHRDDLPRRTSAQGDRRMERRSGRGRRGRRSARWHPHRAGLVALDLFHQRAARSRGGHRRRALFPRVAQPRRHLQARRHRLRPRHGWSRRSHLRGGEHDDPRLDLAYDPGAG